MASYSSARPRGMRGIRGADLLALARERFGASITEGELDASIAEIGGEAVSLTDMRQMASSLFRRDERWRRGYLVPVRIFDGLELPSRFRRPRAGRAR